MKKILYIASLFVAATLALTSCVKEVEIATLNCELEQPSLPADEQGKNFMWNEHLIYWEGGDSIAASTSGGEILTISATANQPEGYGPGYRYAQFDYPVVDGNIHYLRGNLFCVYPASAWVNNSSASNPIINFPAVMPYRSGDVTTGGGDVVDPDHTFGKSCFPMVACLDNNDLAYGETSLLGFHSVNGILRVGIFCTAEAKTIKEIEFSSTEQISGNFKVKALETNAPYLAPNGSNTDAEKKIVITNVHKTVGNAVNGNQELLTFYLPLPAQETSHIQGSDQRPNLDLDAHTYTMTIKVKTEDGKEFSKGFQCYIRRNAMSKMQVVEIDQWHECHDGANNVHMVGNGTKDRPFQIYYPADLVKVRDAMNSNPRGTINGQQITKDTYFKIVRSSDMILDGTTWTEGFKDFTGHITLASGHPTIYGVCNNSGHPVFESISPQGVVDSFAVRSTGNVAPAAGYDNGFSPFCITNNGTMRNCVNRANVTEATVNLAGVCVDNYGLIAGSRNEGKLHTTANVGGLVYTNHPVVSDSKCEIIKCVMVYSDDFQSGSEGTIGGLVHDNYGRISTCAIVTNKQNATTHWGIVVYENFSGANIENCEVSGLFGLQSNSTAHVGGIVNRNQGNVLQCRNTMGQLKGGSLVGGLVAYMNGGSVQSCYSTCANITSTTTADMGGLIGEIFNGVVRNCFSLSTLTPANDNGNNHLGGIVGKLSAGTFANCYSASGSRMFYGDIAASGWSLTECYHTATTPDNGLRLLTRSGQKLLYQGSETALLANLRAWVTANGNGQERALCDWKEGTNPPMLKVSTTIQPR